MDDRNHILLWSGGFDSTAVLLNTLKNKDMKIKVCGCHLVNANSQSEDLAARTAIADTLKLTSIPNVTYAESKVDIDLSSDSLVSGQAQVWAYLASTLVDESVGNVLTMGYIKHDDFWHFRPWFENATTNLIRCENDNVDLSFYYPFEWNEKRELAFLYFDHLDVFDQISWAGGNGECKLKEKAEIKNIIQNYRWHKPNTEPINSDNDYYI